MTYNFSVALHYLTLHQIIQKLEKLIFLLKCVARWFLNLDTRFNWAPLPFSIISWVRCTAPSPDGFFVGTVWQGFGGGRGRAFFPLCLQLLSTWLITMERKWVKMSYLRWKSATEQKQFTLRNPSVNLARKRKRCHHRFLCILILTGLSFQSCTLEHSGHLWEAVWLSGWFTSHPVHRKPFTLHLLAQSTLSTEQSRENTIDATDNK